MKKRDLKKLALMGMTGGLILGSQSLSANNNAIEEANNGTYLAASCGSRGQSQGSCGSRGTNTGTYYQPQGSGHSCGNRGTSNQGPNYQPQNPTSHACGGQSPNSYQPQGAYSQSCGATCGNKKATQPSNAYTQSCGGCSSKKTTQPSNAYTQSCGGCNSRQRPSTETADAYPVEHSCGNQKSAYYHINTADQYQPNSSGQNQTYYPNQNSNKNQTRNATQSPQASNVPYYNPSKTLAQGTTPTTQKILTESDLLNQLNAQGKATYQSLSPEGKALALKLANQTCKGQNECKGLNSCKTETNACGGQGGCKGTSPGPFTDKNAAVKVAAQKMAEKRNNANKVNGSGKLNK